MRDLLFEFARFRSSNADVTEFLRVLQYADWRPGTHRRRFN